MRRKQKSKIRETLEAVVIAFLIAMVIRTFVIQAFKIPSGSMIPTLLVGDHILVNKFLLGTPVDVPFTNINLFRMPGLRKVQRGDIVVFKFPADTTRDFIKRVVGTEGDVVESRDKELYVNGRKMVEEYAQRVDTTVRVRGSDCRYDTESPDFPNSENCRDNFGPFIVPSGKVFVMGDNRDQSYDSRFWRFVDTAQIKGKAMIIYWSWDSSKTWVRFARLGRLIQ